MELTHLPCHSIIFVMLLFNLYLPGFFWACCMLSFCSILVIQHYHRASSHAVLCIFGPFHSFGHSQPVSSPWASLTHSNSSFSWVFAKSFGLPQPILPYPLLSGLVEKPMNPYLLNSLLWASLAHSCILSISHNAHRFTTSFSELLWARLPSLRPFCYFIRPINHYSCHLGLMVFFSIY